MTAKLSARDVLEAVRAPWSMRQQALLTALLLRLGGDVTITDAEIDAAHGGIATSLDAPAGKVRITVRPCGCDAHRRN